VGGRRLVGPGERARHQPGSRARRRRSARALSTASGTAVKVWPGKPYPLGAYWDGSGTNFSVFSEVADRVELCLFDSDGALTLRVDLPEVFALCWHGYLPGIGPGQLYAFRVHGPWDPDQGHRFDPSKLLLDPYAKATVGQVEWNEAVFAHRFDDPDGEPNRLDSEPYMPRCLVVDERFDWGDDRPPATPLHQTIIYELHVKGFTARHPGVPAHLRGTYAGLAHPAAIQHLVDLGVTAVELMPVHQFIHDAHLLERGLRNYWGYNSIGFFAPHNGYASGGDQGDEVHEFKAMVKALHAAGLEVILDVVYNHTAEGNHLGPILSFKGIDNVAYYRLVPENLRYYMDYTGTGNSLNMRHPHVLQLLMDSLRYWVLEMHVDGFRFDLASTLARELHAVDRLSAFFDVIQQDPIVSQVKLIAEPWDVGEGGYQVGNFPALWCEWNGRYRDSVRDFWRGEATLGEFASRLTGSSDLYEDTGRRPVASINFVTAHDGFTLHDLVSYNEKHNEANGEGNRDGESHNRSWNCGVEGPTTDEAITLLRARQTRNFLATLLLSQGVPMLLAGDEIGRTQWGNNNAYCQDSELSWIDWEHQDEALCAFTRRLVALRRAHPVFRRRRWLVGRPIQEGHREDIAWFRPNGARMREADWHRDGVASLGVFLNGHGIPTPDKHGDRIIDATFYYMLNAHHEPMEFVLPRRRWGTRWTLVFDTAADPLGAPDERAFSASDRVMVESRSMVLLIRVG
jgi:glycogen operon protein